MKILILSANCRKNGYTQRLTDLFIRGIRNAGSQPDVIDLTSAKINHCKGCYHCWLATPGICVHKDDMVEISDRFRDSDIVVFSSPLHSYNVSSYLKVFLDRMFFLTKEGFVTTDGGLLRNTLRTPETWPKKMAAILVGAFRSKENFSGAQKSLELFAQGIDVEMSGILIRPESFLLSFHLAKPKTVKTIETAFEKAGLELATQGKISPETLEKASMPLSADVSNFHRYSNIYWEHAKNAGEKTIDTNFICDAVTSDVRVLLDEMARCIDPKATKKIRAVLQFDFPDKNLHFRISVDHGACGFAETESESCDLRIITDTDIWAKIFKREIIARDALISKQIRLEGDKALFSRLDRYFPPPSS